MNESSRIFVAGHRGMVGSAIWRELQARGFRHLLGRTRQELNLLDGPAVRALYQSEQPENVLTAGARVGGIGANNNQPAEYLYENLEIQHNLIEGPRESGLRKLLFLGSS